MNSFSENSIWRHTLSSPWYYSYNFIDIWHLIDMYSQPHFCSNDSEKGHKTWEHRRNTEKNNKQKNFNLKTWYYFLGFSYKHSIYNSCNLPNSCCNYLVNPQTMNNVRCTFFKRWQVSKLVHFCTKFKVN